MSASATRKYDSSRRREGAERNRDRVVKTAHRLFLKQGYASSTLKQVAEKAGVAAPTVYSMFGNKRALLFAVFDAARGAEDHPPDWQPLEQMRPLSAALVAERVRIIREGGAPVARIIDRAAAADPEIAKLWRELQDDRLERMRALAGALVETGVADGDTGELADELWGITSNELYGLLVLDRGWSPSRYEEWLGATLQRTVFTHRTAS